MLFSGKYGQIFTSSFVMSETGTVVAIRNTTNASNFVQQSKELFIGNKKLAILLQLGKNDEFASWDLMIKTNRNAKFAKDILSWVDCSIIVLCKKHRIEYIASFDAHFDSFLRRVK